TPRLHRADSDPWRLPEHSHRAQDRLGIRMANADRRRARVRRELGFRWTRLVCLRKEKPAADPGGLRRLVDRDPLRAARRESDLPGDRAAHGRTVGDAELTADLFQLVQVLSVS